MKIEKQVKFIMKLDEKDLRVLRAALDDALNWRDKCDNTELASEYRNFQKQISAKLGGPNE